MNSAKKGANQKRAIAYYPDYLQINVRCHLFPRLGQVLRLVDGAAVLSKLFESVEKRQLILAAAFANAVHFSFSSALRPFFCSQ
jgi:hypothetical protein